MLYISTGDGGYANDWGIGHNPADGNGQDMDSKHGKILRLDVNTPGAETEIYASGLRNPWRCSFDMADGIDALLRRRAAEQRSRKST